GVDFHLSRRSADDSVILRSAIERRQRIGFDLARLQLPRREHGQEPDTTSFHLLHIQRLRSIIAEVKIDRRPAEKPCLLPRLQNLALNAKPRLLLLQLLDLRVLGLPRPPCPA